MNGGTMSDENNKTTINIDGRDYSLEDLSEKAKAQLINIQFVDSRIQQLNNEWAVADTARIGYTNALKNDINRT